jgi:hypothetical protein
MYISVEIVSEEQHLSVRNIMHPYLEIIAIGRNVSMQITVNMDMIFMFCVSLMVALPLG